VKSGFGRERAQADMHSNSARLLQRFEARNRFSNGVARRARPPAKFRSRPRRGERPILSEFEEAEPRHWIEPSKNPNEQVGELPARHSGLHFGTLFANDVGNLTHPQERSSADVAPTCRDLRCHGAEMQTGAVANVHEWKTHAWQAGQRSVDQLGDDLARRG